MTSQDYFPTYLPAPYPDECLYSIFSRYHVRSGNRRDSQTKAELFGSETATLWGSILSPYRLYAASRWGIPSPFLPKSRRLLLKKHTAYSLYRLFIKFSHDQHVYDELIDKGTRDRTLISPRHYYSKPNRIRYCPSCAQAEKKMYGEPYWHTLHQIPEVRYCPIHGSPLLESSVGYQNGQHHFQPAYTVLKTAEGNPSLELPEKEDKESAVLFAKDLLWISNVEDDKINGQSFRRAFKRIKEEQNKQNYYYISCEELGLKHQKPLSVYERQILAEEKSLFPPHSSAIAYTVVYLRAYFGGITSFYERYVKNDP